MPPPSELRPTAGAGDDADRERARGRQGEPLDRRARGGDRHHSQIPPPARELSLAAAAAASLLSPSPLLTYAPEWSRLPSYLPTGYRPSPCRSQSQPSDCASEPYGPSDEGEVGARTSASRRCPQAGRRANFADGGSGDRLWPVDVSARLLIRGDRNALLPAAPFLLTERALFWPVLFIS
jgi:hypothetical protein